MKSRHPTLSRKFDLLQGKRAEKDPGTEKVYSDFRIEMLDFGACLALQLESCKSCVLWPGHLFTSLTCKRGSMAVRSVVLAVATGTQTR